MIPATPETQAPTPPAVLSAPALPAGPQASAPEVKIPKTEVVVKTPLPLDQLQEFLKDRLPSHKVEIRNKPRRELVASRETIVDLVIREADGKLSGSTYGFLAARIHQQIMDVLKQSPLEVLVKTTHLHPNGR